MKYAISNVLVSVVLFSEKGVQETKNQFREWNLGSYVAGDRQQDVLKSLWRQRSLADRPDMVLGVVSGLRKEYTHTWKVVKGMSLFNSDLIYDPDL